eukprot:SAG11_NODE_3616_length_2337_cov_1.323503_2_plen_175_part_00
MPSWWNCCAIDSANRPTDAPPSNLSPVFTWSEPVDSDSEASEDLPIDSKATSAEGRWSLGPPSPLTAERGPSGLILQAMHQARTSPLRGSARAASTQPDSPAQLELELRTVQLDTAAELSSAIANQGVVPGCTESEEGTARRMGRLEVERMRTVAAWVVESTPSGSAQAVAPRR